MNAMATKKKKKEVKAARGATKKSLTPARTEKSSQRSPVKTSKTSKAVGSSKKPVATKARTPPRRVTAVPKAANPKKPPPRKKVVAAAPPPKKKSKAAAPEAKPVRRRDALGHLDPKYAADLRRQSGPRERQDGERGAFLERPRSKDDLAESFGEQFVETVTSGEDDGEDVLDQEVVEEQGGPFVESTGGAEFADGTDASNPEGAKREPFPTT